MRSPSPTSPQAAPSVAGPVERRTVAVPGPHSALPYRRRRTSRLDLRAVTLADVGELHTIASDPRTWTYAPERRHTDPDETLRWVRRARRYWRRDGLSYWTARPGGPGRPGPVVGVGGVQLHRRPGSDEPAWWNLFYRFSPEVWGRGLATHLGAEALAAAAGTDPDVPVVAWIVPTNTASVAVAERLGLVPSPVPGRPLGDRLMLAWSDRPLS